VSDEYFSNDLDSTDSARTSARIESTSAPIAAISGASEPICVASSAIFRRDFALRALLLGPHWQPKPPRGLLKIDGVPTSE
jgi:hypothetical protein